jgi:hypothetical protein
LQPFGYASEGEAKGLQEEVLVMSTTESGLPAEPILRYRPMELANLMAARLGGRAESHYRTVARAHTRGHLSATAADKVAIALGTHPVLLWGRVWERR